jgi:8-oxo-dGTP pyrophosphatase MutT (NUDIX family)
MAVVPRPASTVVLMNECSKVYLTRRPVTMKFFGGYWVFPGGAIDKTDYLSHEEYIHCGDTQPAFHPAYYVAAARELFEEAGVLLVCNEAKEPLSLEQQKRNEYRQLLLSGEISFFEMLKKEKLHLFLDRFTFFGQLITPEESSIRFDTRFFLAKLPKGQSPQPDLHEVDDALWFSPEEALAENQKGNIPLGPPTILALKTIMDSEKGKPLMMPDLVSSQEWLLKNMPRKW